VLQLRRKEKPQQDAGLIVSKLVYVAPGGLFARPVQRLCDSGKLRTARVCKRASCAPAMGFHRVGRTNEILQNLMNKSHLAKQATEKV
jgi:hypothetical protein